MQTSTSLETIREHVRVTALLCNLLVLMPRKWQLGDNLTTIVDFNFINTHEIQNFQRYI